MATSLKHFLLVTLTILLVSSCEKETYIDYYIDNQSSSSVTVNGRDIIHSTDVTKTIVAKEKTKITHWSKRGLQTELFQPTSMFGNNMLIVNSNGDTLQRDYKSLSNWQSSVDNQRKTASHDYTLIITDADF
jgi:hypothetical protein